VRTAHRIRGASLMSATLLAGCLNIAKDGKSGVNFSQLFRPTPSPTASPVLVPEPTPTPIPSLEPSPTASPLLVPEPTPTPTPTPFPTPTPTPVPTPTATPFPISARHLGPTPDPVSLAAHEFGLVELDRYAGGPGSWVSIRGQYFGASSGLPVQVLFSGTLASRVERQSDHVLRVEVPVRAVSGEIGILVGGVLSNTLPFKVLTALTVRGPAEVLQGSTADYRVDGIADTAELLPDPVVDWVVPNPEVSFDRGLLMALAPGDLQVSVTTGAVSGSLPVHLYRVDGIQLTPSSLELVAAAGDGSGATPSPGFVTSVQVQARVIATDEALKARAVVWSIDDPTVATVQDGRVQAGAILTPARTILRATSVDDPRIQATASVTVTPMAGLDVVVD